MHKIFALKISTWTLLILATTTMLGQQYGFKADHIGYAEDLSGQLVRSIRVDNYGHLWIATFSELNKYDGYTNKIYDTNNSLVNSGIFIDLLKDLNGNIWTLQIDTIQENRFRNSEHVIHSYHITVIEPLSTEFFSSTEYLKHPELNLQDLIWVFERQGIIYLIDKHGSVFCYDGEVKKLFEYDTDIQFVGITDRETYCIITKENEIEERDFKHKLVYRYDKELAFDDRVSIGEHGTLLYMDKSQAYYEGLYLLKNGNMTKLPQYRKNPSNSSNVNRGKYRALHFSFLEGEDLITRIDGQVYFNKEVDDIYSKLGVDFKHATDIERSQPNTYYISTDIGVSVLQPLKVKFNAFKKGINQQITVRGMLKHKDIMISKNENNLVEIISPDSTYDTEFINNKMKYGIGYYRDSADLNLIYVCGYVDNGIQIIDLIEQEVIIPEKPEWGELNSFHRSSFTNDLYAYGASGLYKKTDNITSWKRVKLNTDSIKITGVNHIAESDENDLLLATEEGLINFNENKGTKQLISFTNEETPIKLSFVHKDKVEDDIYWLGTKHNGIIRYDLKKEQEWYINSTIGLSNNNIHAILEDDRERLWVSTNKHLNCIDKVDSSIYIFTTNDGLSHEEFNKFSYFVDESTDEFYFGGLDGYNYFEPNKIDLKNKTASLINISKASTIKKDGLEYMYSTDALKENELKIAESDVIINLTCTVNNIFKTEDRNFYYRIEGINNNWIELTSNNLSLTGLPYGRHTLEIVADLYKASTKTKIRTITLDHAKPFYKSQIFIVGCLLLFALLVYLWFKKRTKRILNKNKELEAQINLRTQELQKAHDTKNKILAILSHDLKSPMGGLRNYYEKLDYLLKKNRIDEIKEISRISKSRIKNLEMALDNLLIWALAESENISSKPELLSLKLEIDAVVQLFDHITDKKNLIVNNELNVMDQVMVDKNIIQTILRNVIHNAFKFSYSSGKIEIKKILDNDKLITISIRDHGIGMDQANIKQDDLQVLDSNQGLGFGLTTSKDLAKIADIHIDIDSHGIQGTEVRLGFSK